ncbi:MAG: hypothetical protein M1300_07990 [Epsilonproteobacteria bacterium]|nr:hypothetical protein [Campylobacterota bacterium]
MFSNKDFLDFSSFFVIIVVSGVVGQLIGAAIDGETGLLITRKGKASFPISGLSEGGSGFTGSVITIGRTIGALGVIGAIIFLKGFGSS